MTADSVYSLANWTLLGALILGVLSTYAIVVSGNIKEKEFKLELSKANEVAEKAKTDAANANERAADANQKAAELNNRAATLEKEAVKLKLELAKRTQPLEARAISPKQAEILKSALTGRSLIVGLMWPTSEHEVDTYAKQLEAALINAGVHIGIKGGSEGRISSGSETLMGNGISIVGGTDVARGIITDAFLMAGIPFVIGVPPIGIEFGNPIIVVGSRPALSN